MMVEEEANQSVNGNVLTEKINDHDSPLDSSSQNTKNETSDNKPNNL